MNCDHIEYCRDGYIRQEKGTCCFVWASANCAIYLKKPLPDLEEACKIGLCEYGGVIAHSKVIKHFDLPLTATTNKEEIYENGGIINIFHPIHCGHCFFMYPENDRHYLINSWLGPNVTSSPTSFLDDLIRGNFGDFWRLKNE